MKKIFSQILLFVLIMILPHSVNAESKKMETGAYYAMGQYNNIPIIWRCIGRVDDNGLLMVSDKILCFKAFSPGGQDSYYSNDCWEESTIRTWLNSKDNEGSVKWTNNIPNSENLNVYRGYEINFPYSNEAGFLCNNNFSTSEKSVIKTVSQWHALPLDKLNRSENIQFQPYITEYSSQSSLDGGYKTEGRIKLSELSNSYKGAMYRLTDTMFLLNEPQLYAVLNTLGTIGSEVSFAHKLGSGQVVGFWHGSNSYDYWLRSHGNNNLRMVNAVYGNQDIIKTYSVGELGIRPAFYLNEDVAVIKSGSGTENDPYILDGIPQEGITVFSKGEQIEFPQQPVLENDRTLVGMRAIFESLDANIKWDGETNTVTATKDNTEIELQIDNTTMLVNDNSVELDTPARLINDTTMVPLRAVSEALDAKVEWIGDLQRIVIDVQPEWKESDWAPDWYIKAMKAGGYF